MNEQQVDHVNLSMKLITLFLVLFSPSVMANDYVSYRLNPSCIQSLEIAQQPFSTPPRAPNYQVNVTLTPEQSEDLIQFTAEIIGSKMRITNGHGKALALRPSRVVTAIRGSFVLQPFSSAQDAQKAVDLLMEDGGYCGNG